MARVITIDPGKSKCGLVLAEILLKKDYELEAGNEYKFTISAKF